jgi:hypothetical protein
MNVMKTNSYVIQVSILLCSSSLSLFASPATWTFGPSKVGRALHEGWWTVEYALGQINASPDFCVLGTYPQITPIFTGDETEFPASSVCGNLRAQDRRSKTVDICG